MSVKNGKPNPVALHVGLRLRLQRLTLKMSQQTLADAVGVSFQQIQKYERGTNRISASRLYRAAEFLNVPISFFFEDYGKQYFLANDANAPASNLVQLVNSPDGIAFTNAILSVKDNEVRKNLLALTRTLGAKL